MGTVGTPQEWGDFQKIGGTTASLLDDDSNPLVKERKIHRPHQYHYVIGNYDASTYYKKILSDDLIRMPGGISHRVLYQTATLSLDSKSEFRTWFRMPL